MKKPYKFDELSTKVCACGKALKKNIVERKPNAFMLKCYACFRKASKAPISTAREVRTGKRIGREKGIYSPL